MKILVIGASRGIGRQVVLAALAAGHNVAAMARNPDKIGLSDPKLRLVAGDVLEPEVVRQAVKGQEAVICALGLPTLQAMGPPLASRTYVLSSGTQNIINAMEETQVARLICVTAIGTGDSASQCTPAARIMLRSGLRWLFLEKDRQEVSIRASKLDWTIIRPTALTNGSKRRAMVAPDLPSGTLTHVSRADVAAVILDLITDRASVGQALVASYPPRFGDATRWLIGYFGGGSRGPR